MKKIAILGATGYIGRSISEIFFEKKEFQTFLFSRLMDESRNILPNSSFLDYEFDVILNCIGLGDPRILKDSGISIFSITEDVDNMILKGLEKSPEALAIHISSGAVYNYIDISNISPRDFYTIAKINSEAKHRSLDNLNIVDLRVFAFFSHLVDTDTGFFMSDVIKCLKENKVLNTSTTDMIRDYICPEDLYMLIKVLISIGKVNDFFDVYSKEPVSKFNLLSFFKNKYNLKYNIVDDSNTNSPTGLKSEYFSKNKKAEILGYVPKFTSISGIDNEIKKMGIIN